MWTYDNAGNITSKKTYAYTTGTLGTVVSTVNYVYGNTEWGDLLTTYSGKSITYDTIGNPLSDGTWNYTWIHGRQLASMSKSGTTWNFTYDANGMRTKRTNGTTTYNYFYNGSQLAHMTVGGNTLHFYYDANGYPMAVKYNGILYYYATNLQGDVVAIINGIGMQVVGYTYDAWGRVLSTTGSLASTLGTYNPLRYRGYVYDSETQLYYLQSRYYNPAMGRFINADGQLDSGNVLGLNLFAYCGNNPVNRVDPTGHAWYHWALGAAIVAGFALATVITCGGFAAAATAVGLVSSGIALSSSAATIATAAFIGSATVYGTSVLAAAGSSNSLQDFADRGNWWTVAYTAYAAGLGALNGHSMYQAQQYTSRGSTGRTEPHNLKEKLAMEQVKSNPLDGAQKLPIKMTDTRWLQADGWVKMANNVNGVEIHFVFNQVFYLFDDFKFKG